MQPQINTARSQYSDAIMKLNPKITKREADRLAESVTNTGTGPISLNKVINSLGFLNNNFIKAYIIEENLIDRVIKKLKR